MHKARQLLNYVGTDAHPSVLLYLRGEVAVCTPNDQDRLRRDAESREPNPVRLLRRQIIAAFVAARTPQSAPEVPVTPAKIDPYYHFSAGQREAIADSDPAMAKWYKEHMRPAMRGLGGRR